MATIQTKDTAHQHFTAGAGDKVIFSRSAIDVLLNTSGAMTISFDNGDGYMDIQAGTYHWKNINVKNIIIGSGSCTGCGFSF